jgi:hypothetical protein
MTATAKRSRSVRNDERSFGFFGGKGGGGNLLVAERLISDRHRSQE